jgi:hypothetical protein
LNANWRPLSTSSFGSDGAWPQAYEPIIAITRSDANARHIGFGTALDWKYRIVELAKRRFAINQDGIPPIAPAASTPAACLVGASREYPISFRENTVWRWIGVDGEQADKSCQKGELKSVSEVLSARPIAGSVAAQNIEGTSTLPAAQVLVAFLNDIEIKLTIVSINVANTDTHAIHILIGSERCRGWSTSTPLAHALS